MIPDSFSVQNGHTLGMNWECLVRRVIYIISISFTVEASRFTMETQNKEHERWSAVSGTCYSTSFLGEMSPVVQIIQSFLSL